MLISSDKAKFKICLEKGNKLNQEGKLAEAIEQYLETLHLNPDCVPALNQLAGICISRKEFDQAINHIQHVTRLQPNNGLAHARLARSMMAQKNIQGAIASYQKAIKLQPEQPVWAYIGMGDAFYQNKQLEKAIIAYHKAIEIKPDNSIVHAKLARAMMAQKNFQGAIASYQKAITLQSDQPVWAYIGMGDAFYQNKQLKKAIIAYHKAIEIKPDNSIVHAKLARAMMAQKNFQEAITFYQKAITLQSDQPVWVYHSLGDLLNQNGQIDEALITYRKAIEIEPENNVVNVKLAKTMMTQKQKSIQANSVLNKKFNNKDNQQFFINSLVKQIRENPERKHLYWQLVTLVSRKKFDVTEKELTELKKLNNCAHNQALDGLIDYAIYNIETRKNNYLWMRKYQYKIISLGSNCLPRTIPTMWGLKYPKIMGELTHPFDLSVHPYKSICKLINNNFQDYLNPLFLKQTKSGIPRHTKYKINFNHEKADYFYQNNYSKLIETYEARIKNFYNDITSSPILFIHVNYRNKTIFPSKLAQILQNKFSGVYHKLLYINTTEFDFDVNKCKLPENMIVKHIPYPNEKYIWHEPSHYTSEAGNNFELMMINTIKQLIIDYFPKITSDNK